MRPPMSTVTVKTEEQHAQAVMFRLPDMQEKRTQLIAALRGHLAEFGVLPPEQRAGIARVLAACRDLGPRALPTPVVDMA